MNKEPTQEQVRKPTEEQLFQVIEWCGFKHIPAKYCKSCKRWEGEYWIKEGIGRRIYRTDLLEMTNSDNLLGFLFKYAVPMLIEGGYRISIETALADEPWYWWIIEKDDEQWKADRPDPALALFWALWKVKEAK